MNRKLLGAVSVLVLILGGCGQTNGGATGAAVHTLRIWYSTDDPVERVWSQGLARRFEAAHAGTRVQLVDYSFEDLNTKLQLALSAGTPPDLAYVTPRGPGIPAYVGAHTLQDLSTVALQNHWTQMLRPGLLAQYNAPFAGYGARPGEVLAVPTGLAAVALLYNRRLLARLHLAVPATTATFVADLAQAKKAGFVPLGMGNADGWLGDDWYVTLINAALSPTVLQPEQQLQRGFSFAQPPFLQAGLTLSRWATRGYFTHDFGGLDAQEGIDQFFKGRTLFQLVSSSQNAQIMRDQRQTTLPIGVFAFPRAAGGTTMPVSGYLGWVVPRRGLHHALAEKFITSLLQPSTTQYLLQQGVLPAAVLPDQVTIEQIRRIPAWQREYLTALRAARPGLYLDAAPIGNLNATMEANMQLLLQGIEGPDFLVRALQQVYTSHGKHGSQTRIDGEF